MLFAAKILQNPYKSPDISSVNPVHFSGLYCTFPVFSWWLLRYFIVVYCMCPWAWAFRIYTEGVFVVR